jgi:RNA polymerase sigma-70 factor (ECF subfamily)
MWGMTGKQLEFSSFYASARDDCLRIVLVTVGDRQLAEDLVAEAFTRAWASWRTVRRHPAPQAWVVRTALNLSVSWWRRRRRETALGCHDPVAPGDEGGGPEGELLAAVRQLPARQQQVIILRGPMPRFAVLTASLVIASVAGPAATTSATASAAADLRAWARA